MTCMASMTYMTSMMASDVNPKVKSPQFSHDVEVCDASSSCSLDVCPQMSIQVSPPFSIISVIFLYLK